RFEFMRRKLNVNVHLNTCGSIDLCDIGPNMVVYPDNIVYSNIQESDIPDIIKFFQGGPVVERLLLTPQAPAEKQRHGFFADLKERGNSVGEADAMSMAETDGQAEGFVAEQMRRGFMAKK